MVWGGAEKKTEARAPWGPTSRAYMLNRFLQSSSCLLIMKNFVVLEQWFSNCASRRPSASLASQNNLDYTMGLNFNHNFVSFSAKNKPL